MEFQIDGQKKALSITENNIEEYLQNITIKYNFRFKIY